MMEFERFKCSVCPRHTHEQVEALKKIFWKIYMKRKVDSARKMILIWHVRLLNRLFRKSV